MLVELHIIQNFSPSCLNRDDTNAPKDCRFGGYRRARISSQCVKRSIRTYFSQNADKLHLKGYLASRTKLLAEKLSNELVKEGKNKEDAIKISSFIIEANGMMAEQNKTSYLLFIGEDEIASMKKHIIEKWDDLQKALGEKAGEKKEKKAKKKGDEPTDLLKIFNTMAGKKSKAVDVALFGRMLADMPEQSVDAACQVAHAISTNKVEMEMDFFTAIDDLQPREESGGGHLGIVEFNSSCFYRYSVIDVAQLKKNLDGDFNLTSSAILAFVEASVNAIPTGKQNSMAAQNPPDYVRVVVKENTPPCNLANAFLTPAKPTGDKSIVANSIEALCDYEGKVKKMYTTTNDGIKLDMSASTVSEFGKDTISQLLTKLGEALR